MLYEPPKTKKYILIGAGAVVLAVLIVAFFPLIYKNKTTQNPAVNLSPQAKLQQEKIQKDMKSLSEEMKKMSAPSQEDMQKVSKKLNQSIK